MLLMKFVPKFSVKNTEIFLQKMETFTKSFLHRCSVDYIMIHGITFYSTNKT